MGTPQIPSIDSDSKLFPPVVMGALGSSLGVTAVQKPTDPVVGGKQVQKVQANTWLQGLNVFGNNDGMAADPRQPTQFNVVIDGSKLDRTTYGSNKTGFVNNIGFKGGFAAESATPGLADPRVIFGEVVFTYTGSANGDLNGIDAYYAQTSEAHMYTPGAVLGTMIGHEFVADVEASATGAKVENAYGAHFRAPVDRVGGVVKNAYGAYFEAGTTAQNNWSAMFKGLAQFDGRAFFAGQTPSSPSAAPGTYVGRDSGAGSAIDFCNGTTDIQMGNSLANQFEVREAGVSVMLSVTRAGYVTANGGFAFKPTTQTTAPAAGGASALPASPSGYMTIKVNGTDRQVAYY